jgi:hypothetical protein
MPFYEYWEKTAVLLVPGGAHPEHPIVIPPPDAGVMPPIYHPVDPGFGQPSPPGIVMPPIYYPVDPGFGQPSPPERPDSPEPVVPPDMASPGFWAHVVAGDGSTRYGWVQLSWNTDPGHVPVPPTDGLPGYWIVAYAGEFGMQPTWIPTWSWS